jgi:hypothetical protein
MLRMMKARGKKRRDHWSINKATSRPLQKVTYWGPGGGGGGPRAGLEAFPLKRRDEEVPL